MTSTKRETNILLLDTGKEWGGGTNSLIELLKRIDKNKYRFTALFYTNYKKNKNSDIKTELQKLGISFLLLDHKGQSFGLKMLKEFIRIIFFFSRKARKYIIFLIDYTFKIKKNARRISKILRDNKIDLLYMNNQPSSNLEGIIASKLTNVPALQHSRIEAFLNHVEVGAANQWLSKIICVSEGVKKGLVKQGVRESKCTVIHNGIDLKTKPVLPVREIREKWGISDADIVIGTVGSLVKRKRIKDLIKAFSIVNKTKASLKCIIIGDGPEKDKLILDAERKNLNSRIIFTGFQTDAISYINAMDIFVLTSEKEGLPRVILEAMLMGKPVVASKVTGPSELVVDGKTGFLVPVKNIAMLSDAILRLLKSGSLRKDMGRRAQERVANKFSIDKYIAGVSRIFEEVL